MKLKMPFRVPRVWEAKEAVSRLYWDASKKRANSKPVRAALKSFFQAMKDLKDV
jgi:hypothetical protein